MLQKLSISEVKAWLCWNLIILLPLQFYVKSNFGEFKHSKNVNFVNSKDSELWILVNIGHESCSNFLKSKFRTSKMVKNDIFWLFDFAKTWFHVKSEWQYNDQTSTKWSLNFTFCKFLEHSAFLKEVVH